MFNLFRKKERPIETTTITKFKLVFHTTDGRIHAINTLPYIDTSRIDKPIEYLLHLALIGRKDLYILDDSGTAYFISNIIKATVKPLDSKNVIKRYYDDCPSCCKTVYPKSEIEEIPKIWEEKNV